MTTAYGGSGDLRRSLELLWSPPARGRPGPRPGLCLPRIVAVAVEVADAEGIEAVSMRRVAAELGVGTMSLYRHVPGKRELLDLMLEAVTAPPADPAIGEGDWRAVLKAMARQGFQRYLDHPWLLQVNWSRPVLGPSALASLNQVMTGLRDLPLSDQEKVIVVSAVESLVNGVARNHLNAQTAAEQTGVSDEEFWAAQLPCLQRAIGSGEFPALAAMSEHSFGAGWERTLEFALDRLLDGIAALVERRTAAGADTPPARTMGG